MSDDTYTLQVHEHDGTDQDFEVNGESAARFCAQREFEAATTRRVVILDPDGRLIDDLVKAAP